MKKILILAYDFPPYVSVGGLRPVNWHKYLHEYGVYPIVVTRQWNNVCGNHLDYVAPSKSKNIIIEKSPLSTLIKTPYKPNLSNKLLLKYGEKRFNLLRKVISGFYEYMQYVFPIGPKVGIYHGAKKYMKTEKVDIILATGDPFVLFKYASRLSDRFNIPWIADYRDPWSQDTEIQKYFLYQKWCAYFEKKITPKATLVTTVSDFLKTKISTLTSVTKIEILQNGYDSEIIDKVKNISQQNKKLSLAYIGTIYDWYPIESFIATCHKFILSHKDVNFQLNFYGINKEHNLKKLLFENYVSLLPYINFLPKQENYQLLTQLATDNVFILFNNFSFLGTKIFDYLALNRQILFCYTEDKELWELKNKYYRIEEDLNSKKTLQEDMLKETGTGLIIKNSEHLLKKLNDLYEEFQSKGYIENHTIGVEKYSRKIQTKKLADIIKKIT